MRADIPSKIEDPALISRRRAQITEAAIDQFAKRCMLDGVDELGYIMQQEPAIQAFEARRVGSIHTIQ